MGYTRTTWVNGTAPAINANNLNNLEIGTSENEQRHIYNEMEVTQTGATNFGNVFTGTENVNGATAGGFTLVSNTTGQVGNELGRIFDNVVSRFRQITGGGNGSYFGLLFGQTVGLSKVRIRNANITNTHVQNFDIEITTNNGGSWSSIGSFVNSNTNGATTQFDLSGQTCDGYRILLTSNSVNGTILDIDEIQADVIQTQNVKVFMENDLYTDRDRYNIKGIMKASQDMVGFSGTTLEIVKKSDSTQLLAPKTFNSTKAIPNESEVEIRRDTVADDWKMDIVYETIY